MEASSMSMRGAAVGSGVPGTISGAIATSESVHQHLIDVAAATERLANLLGGSVPTEAPASGAKGERSASCMVDHLNQRLDALRDPALRIMTALDRIERALG